MHPNTQETELNQRYTPDNYEKAILIRRIGQYFSYPERSEYRNKITKEVSDLLIKYSKHWTKHNVRVWFNNNRPNYISDLKNYNNYETNNTPVSDSKVCSFFNPHMLSNNVVVQTNKPIKKDLVIMISHFHEEIVNHTQKLVICDSFSLDKINENNICLCNNNFEFNIDFFSNTDSSSYDQNDKLAKMRELKKVYKEINFQKSQFLINEKKKKIELTFSKDIVRKSDTVPTIKDYISNIVFETIDNNLAKKPNSYRYPDEVIDFFFLVKFGPCSYDNLRWIFPIPCVKTLYQRRGQNLNQVVNGILEKGNSLNIINMIFHNYNFEQKVKANLSIDAIEITLFHRNNSKIKNLFIFFIIPLNDYMKPFTIRVFPNKNGKAGEKSLSVMDELISELFEDESPINLQYSSVDGDS